jgi:pimeloyl-ACP methyl ester carboxylesterase
VLLQVGAVAPDPKPVSSDVRLVTVDNRRLLIACRGARTADPTVVLIAGGGFTNEVWDSVKAPAARFARVCSYDRAGVGRSDPDDHPQTAGEIVGDLQALLAQAGERKPYVLVGHSVGGIYARMFAARFPGEVAGLVLVDSAHEEQIWRLAAIAPALVDAEFGSAWRDPRARRDLGFLPDGEPSRWRTSAPLIVLEQGRGLPEVPELGLTRELVPKISEAWHRMQEDLASRSPAGERRTAARSGHFIQKDEPDVVVQAIRDVLDDLSPR